MKKARELQKIDFPVQRSARSRSKLVQDDTERSIPRHRSKRGCTLTALDSPQKPKMHNTESFNTPAKRRMLFDDCNSENQSPAKKRRTSEVTPSSPVSSVQSVRMPLSPINSLNSPLRNSSIISPAKYNCMSPVKRVGLLSPRKFGSPVKSLNSPLRNSSILSPVKQNCASPLKRVGLTSPTRFGSPVKRIGFESPRKESPYSTPMRLARQEGVCYQKAKQALHTALPETLLCREKEYKEVNDFLDHHLKTKKSGSMYISGAPGTGKTAVLSKTLNKIQEEGQYPVIYINCMSFKNSTAIYNRVLSELEGKESRLSAKDATKALEKAFITRKSMVVMITDEVDQLDSKNQEVLYTMFEWPALDKSKLVLIGIANALDLTDRILPRLQAHPKCKPKLLSFAPYTRNQLVAVLQDRLAKVSVNGVQVMEPAAIQFCARKVASQAGDMRKALDVCRRAVEMVEAEVRKQQVLQGCRSPSKQLSAVPKKIGVGHILKIINEVYGSRVTVKADQTIPLQQKLTICTMLLLKKRAGKFKQVTLGKLHDNFSGVCKQQQVAPVDQSEFRALCGLLESRGMLALSRAKDTRSVKITLRLDENELEMALQDKTLMSAVLAKGLK